MKENALVLHSFMAYFVLLMLLIAVVNAVIGWVRNKTYYTLEKDLRISRLTLIVSYMQLAVGLYLFYRYPSSLDAIQEHGMGGLSSAARLLAVEHPFVNILAIILITVGWFRHKNFMEANKKFKTIAIFYGLGLVLFLSRIPWGQWFITTTKFN